MDHCICTCMCVPTNRPTVQQLIISTCTRSGCLITKPRTAWLITTRLFMTVCYCFHSVLISNRINERVLYIQPARPTPALDNASLFFQHAHTNRPQCAALHLYICYVNTLFPLSRSESLFQPLCYCMELDNNN